MIGGRKLFDDDEDDSQASFNVSINISMISVDL